MRWIKFLFLVAVLFAGAFAATWLFLRSRANETSRGMAVTDTAVASARERWDECLRSVESSPNRATTLRLTEEELHELLIAQAAADADGRELLDKVREVRVSVADGELSVGAVVDARALRAAAKEHGESAETVARWVTLLAEDQLYVGVTGTPVAREGGITLADGWRVGLGPLTLPIAELAERLGYSEDEAGRKLLWRLDGYEVTDVQVEGDTVVLAVRVA